MNLEQSFLKKIVQNPELKKHMDTIKLELQNAGCENARAELLALIENNRPIIEEYLNSRQKCTSEPLSLCQQEYRGYKNVISFENGRFYSGLEHCEHWHFEYQYEEMTKQFTFLDYATDNFYMTADVFCKNLVSENIFTADQIGDREKFLKLALSEISKGRLGKGIYLFGNPGIGKTTILKVLANTLAKQKKHSLAFINVNYFINSTKKNISENSNKSVFLLEKLKKAEILFLDDIGSEIMTSWTRDVLFSLLNYRKSAKKITFFSSNYSLHQLVAAYQFKDSNSQVEKIKNKRFFECLKVLGKEVFFRGESIS